MSLLDKVKETAGKVGEQAKHATAVGKEKIEDVQRQRKIDDLYEEIGRLTVATKRGAAPVDVDTQIDAKLSEITHLEQEAQADEAPPAAGAS
jgi:hypothetical protein